jgi:uncharacterized protein DUF3891
LLVIVRERPDSFLLFEQHEHALIAGEFALRWRERHWPFESTVYAVANHDLAWREAGREAFGIGLPYRFIGRDRRSLGSDIRELRVTC